MFTHDCTNCDKHQLIFPSQVSSVAGTDQGVALDFTCWCGTVQTHLMAAAAATRPSDLVAA